MTASTEQERASLSSFIDRAGRDGFDTAHNFFDCGEVVFFNPATADLWNFWQAARRAQVVPHGWKITEEMHVAAVKVLHRASGVDGLPQRMVDAMLAAAPQPPEQIQPKVCKTEIQTIGCIEAAPVQLPEPVGVLHVFTAKAENGEATMAVLRINDANAEKQPLGYHNVITEQQVRQLLASANKPE